MYFTKFQDFDPYGKSKTCKSASFDRTFNGLQPFGYSNYQLSARGDGLHIYPLP